MVLQGHGSNQVLQLEESRAANQILLLEPRVKPALLARGALDQSKSFQRTVSQTESIMVDNGPNQVLLERCCPADLNVPSREMMNFQLQFQVSGGPDRLGQAELRR